jgi:hypothetical protein
MCEGKRLTVSELLGEFPQISLTVLYEIITVRLGYHKFCSRWVPKVFTDAHNIQRMASALTIAERYHRVNVETKEQSKQLMNKHSPESKKLKLFLWKTN